jgi:ABC-2 type transport system ATP-binding protein
VGIKIDNLSKCYGSSSVLKKISLHFSQNGVIGLLGNNGAGKTTLMKILTGYLGHWDGEVTIDGLNLKKDLKKIQAQIGYLPENNPLYSEMYVREYLQFVGQLYKIKNPPIKRLIEKTGLSVQVTKKIGDLSKGFKQRVGLTAALLHDPKYLILDEPTTGLDPNQIIEIRKLIKDLGKKKIVFLSTHILQEVEAVCENVVIINKGEVVLNQSIKELQSDKKQVIEVSFDYRVENIALMKIRQLKTVVNTFDFNYELTFENNEDMRPAIFDFANDNGLKILSLQQKNENLEKWFSSLTKEV